MKRAYSFICILALVTLLLPAAAFGAGESITADSYGEGLLTFRKGKKAGYMDIFGNVVIKPAYSSVNRFHNGMALVQTSGGNYAKDQFINRAGKVVVTAPKRTKTHYYGLCDLWDGDYATAEIWSISKRDGSISPVGYNYVNEKGKLLNDEEYQYAGPFREGFALVGKGFSLKKATRMSLSGQNLHWLGAFSGNDSNRIATEYWYIDKQGQRLGSLTWSMGRDFHNGLAAVAVKAGETLHWGFLNTNGTLQIAPEYASVGELENGLIWVSDGENYGYINERGEVVVPLEWKAARSFDAEGYAVVKDEYHAKVIDRQGRVVLDSEYSNLYPVPGTDRYRADDGIARGLIDRSGKVLVSPAYQTSSSGASWFAGTRYKDILVICNEFGDLITPVIGSEGVISADDPKAWPDGTPCKKIPFSVGEGGSMNLCTFVDEEGRTLSINMVDSMRGEAFTIRHSDGKTVFFDLDGNRLGNTEWDGLKSLSNENVICVKKGDFFGFIDAHTGETLVAPQYTDVILNDDGVFSAMLGKNAAYLDSFARPILPEITKKSGKEAVRALQQKLADLGYYDGQVNGSFSRQLTQAITAAQEAFGLEATGLADSDFQYALENAKP